MKPNYSYPTPLPQPKEHSKLLRATPPRFPPSFIIQKQVLWFAHLFHYLNQPLYISRKFCKIKGVLVCFRIILFTYLWFTESLL